LVDAAKSTVRKHGHHIAALSVGLDVGDDGFDIWEIVTDAAMAGDVGSESGGVESVVSGDFMQISDGGDEGEIRLSERDG
jgi:hypothetical protein